MERNLIVIFVVCLLLRTRKSTAMEILRGKYPELKSAEEYAVVEYTRQICVAVSTAKTIYNLMKRVCPEWIGLDPSDDLSLGDSFESAEAESPEKTVYIQEPVGRVRSPLRRAQSEASGLRHRSWKGRSPFARFPE